MINGLTTAISNISAVVTVTIKAITSIVFTASPTPHHYHPSLRAIGVEIVDPRRRRYQRNVTAAPVVAPAMTVKITINGRSCEVRVGPDGLEQIAKTYLGLPTLARRGSDGLDFSTHAVWELRKALAAAYAAGQASRE